MVYLFSYTRYKALYGAFEMKSDVSKAVSMCILAITGGKRCE